MHTAAEDGRAAQDVLECVDLAKSYAGVRALLPITFTVAAGEVLGIIGPNGSGKTTLLNCLSGATKADGGSVMLQGVQLSGRSLEQRAEAGMARTFQNLRLFNGLTVRQNLLIGGHSRTSRRRAVGRSLQENADIVLERLGLGAVASRPAGALPYGVQRRVEIARALMMQPAVMLLDEPVAGMNDREVEELGSLLTEIAADGMALVVIEHHVGFMVNLAASAIVLDAGIVIGRGEPNELLGRPEVLEAYLG